MPCIDYETIEERNQRLAKAEAMRNLNTDKVNTLTKLLCEATALLDSHQSNFNGRSLLKEHGSTALQQWHKNHTEADLERKVAATDKLIQAAADLGYDIEDARKLRALLK